MDDGSPPHGPKRRATLEDVEVGGRIRSRRIVLGLTQVEFAELIGVTYQQVHKIEKGFNRISAGRLLTACRALRCDPNALLLGPGGTMDGSDSDKEMLELAQGYQLIKSRRNKAAVRTMIRALAGERHHEA